MRVAPRWRLLSAMVTVLCAALRPTPLAASSATVSEWSAADVKLWLSEMQLDVVADVSTLHQHPPTTS